MTIYTVLEPVDGRDVEGRTVFVKDGFSWPALFLAVPWLLVHRLWLVLIGYVATVAGLSLALAAIGADHPAAPIAWLLFAVAFALSANGLRRWTLQRCGFRLAAVSGGRDLEEAERRHFERWTAARRGSAPAPGRRLEPAR